MGLPKAAVNLLLAVAAREPFRGSIATLGRQHVYLTETELRSSAAARGVPLASASVNLHRDPELRAQGYIADDSLYEMLGFASSCRIDQSDYERADEQLDLNQRETPEHLREAFDVVLDSGTIEHVFEIGQALRHCLAMTRPGGRIIHLTPASNSVNHGLYSVSPTLYEDFYTTSGCELERLWLCRCSRHLERGTWNAYDCLIADRNWLPLGRLDGAIWFTFAVVRKLPAAKAEVPQQSFYRSTWESSRNRLAHQAADGTLSEPAQSRAGRLLRWTAHVPMLQSFSKRLIKVWRSLINGYRERRRGRIPFTHVGNF